MKKNIISKYWQYIKDENYRVLVKAGNGYYDNLADDEYLKICFKARVGYGLNLDNPITFNEKLQWLKIHDHNTDYTMMVDKYLVKDYVSSKIGSQYVIPTIGVWDDPEQIDFNMLPNRFVLKCNHNSGLGMCICKDKSTLDVSKVKKELVKGLQQNYYLSNREWPYKDVPRKIIAEKYIDNGEKELVDYKLMCFNGRVRCSFVCADRFSADGLKVTFYDRDWNVMPFERHYPKSNNPLKKPDGYEKMVEFAEILSENIPFVRVDFYEVKGEVLFGELTFYPGSGFEEFNPFEWDVKLGEWIELPEISV